MRRTRRFLIRTPCGCSPAARSVLESLQRNAAIDQVAAVGIAVAECEAKNVQSRLAVVDRNRCEGYWHTIIESDPRDRHRMSDIVEGDRQDLC